MSKGEYPELPQVGVGAVVLHNHKVLLVRRAQPPSEGLWAIPGGKVELGETLREAAEREIREETGICIRAGKPIFTFEVISRDDMDRVKFHYVIVDLLADYIHGTPVAGDDVSEARWVEREELKQLPVNATTLKLLEEIVDFGGS